MSAEDNDGYRRLKILIDCDGVMADFTSAILAWAGERTGKHFWHFDVTQYDVLTAIGHPELKDEFVVHASTPGWCSSFRVWPGTQRALRMLRIEHDVVCVTSPMNTPNWTVERTAWLNWLGFNKDDIIFTSGKHHVRGDVFIDDAAKNCHRWHDEHPNDLTLMWERSYNENEVKPKANNFKTVVDWDQVLFEIGKHSRDFT